MDNVNILKYKIVLSPEFSYEAINIYNHLIYNLISQNLQRSYEEKLNYAFDISGKLKYGYQLYQSFLRIKDVNTYVKKVQRFKDWLDDAESSTIKEFKSSAETLLKWNKEILNSFKYQYTNSSTEGKNNKVKSIKRVAFGFRNLYNFENRIKIRDANI